MNLIYKIQFHSYWHTGSGLSGGTTADSEVIKTENGLPFIPGKTLKGLLKAAATDLQETGTGLISDDFLFSAFGRADEDGTTCHYTNALLSPDVQTLLEEKAGLKEVLFQNIASTAIDDKGQAVGSSLRTTQVTVPLTLYAEILNFPAEYAIQLEYCLKYIKRMGTKRHRGLGRCDWSTVK